jgi:hypothetical protein
MRHVSVRLAIGNRGTIPSHIVYVSCRLRFKYCILLQASTVSLAALISRSMLDDYTSKVSFLAGCFVVVSLFISWYARGDPMVRQFPSYLCHSLTILHRFQLDAIPTIGFSDPILSYLSSLRFYFNRIPMLKEGCEKVICLTLYISSSY